MAGGVAVALEVALDVGVAVPTKEPVRLGMALGIDAIVGIAQFPRGKVYQQAL